MRINTDESVLVGGSVIPTYRGQLVVYTSIRRSMGEAECYEPSSLITSIHKGVPFLTDADVRDKSAELVLNLDEGTKEFYAYFVVSVRVRVRVRCFFLPCEHQMFDSSLWYSLQKIYIIQRSYNCSLKYNNKRIVISNIPFKVIHSTCGIK